MTLEFSDRFLKNLKYEVSWKSVQLEQERRREMTKLRVTFHNFENAPKNTKPFVLVFLAASYHGDEMAEGNKEDSVWTEMFDCFAFFSISLHTLLHSKKVFGLKE